MSRPTTRLSALEGAAEQWAPKKARDNARVARVPVDRLRAHPRNIRSDLGDLRELTESIRHEGVLVPLMAEDHGAYLRLLHGHRRWAAAQLAGLTRVPVIIVGRHEPDEALLLMLAEDKKEPVRDLDRQRAIRALRTEFGYTMAGIAERLGISEITAKRWHGGFKDGGNAGSATQLRRRRGDGAPQPPRIAPRRLHALIQQGASGELEPAALIEQLRELLAGWEPTSVSSRVSDEVVEKVASEDPHESVQAIAGRLGLSERHVVRARRIIREQDAS